MIPRLRDVMANKEGLLAIPAHVDCADVRKRVGVCEFGQSRGDVISRV